MPATNRYQLLEWSPRVLAILYAIFISLFAFDVWSMDGTFWERLGGFLIHLAPTYTILIALFVAWRWPLLGGSLFIAVAVIFSVLFGWEQEWQSFLLLGAPPVIIGLLFLWDGWLKRQQVSLRY